MNSDIDIDQFPALRRLALHATETRVSGAKICDLAEDVRLFAMSGEIAGILNNTVKLFLADPMANPSLMQQDNVVLHDEHLGILIAVGRTKFDPLGSIYSSPADTMLAPLTQAGFDYSNYEIIGAFDAEIFDPSVRVVRTETCTSGLGDVIEFPALHVKEYASSGCCVLKIYDRRAASGLMWEFDRTNGKAIAAYAADTESTTLRYLLKFMAEFSDVESVEPIRGLLKHRFHYVRWEAAKSLISLKPDEMSTIMSDMLTDNHIHIRNAALQTLERNS